MSKSKWPCDLSERARFIAATRYVKRQHQIINIRTSRTNASCFEVSYLQYEFGRKPQLITDTVYLISEHDYNRCPSHMERGKLGRVRGVDVFYKCNPDSRVKQDYAGW